MKLISCWDVILDGNVALYREKRAQVHCESEKIVGRPTCGMSLNVFIG